MPLLKTIDIFFDSFHELCTHDVPEDFKAEGILLIEKLGGKPVFIISTQQGITPDFRLAIILHELIHLDCFLYRHLCDNYLPGSTCKPCPFEKEFLAEEKRLIAEKGEIYHYLKSKLNPKKTKRRNVETKSTIL